ncbi:MAG: ankyrin repeat domain-containing protein, partial [Gammaproteobacteria bacterium]|nr:ankyrin repeat domain-containing protein [Gammaproteobacteria bacterium]
MSKKHSIRIAIGMAAGSGSGLAAALAFLVPAAGAFAAEVADAVMRGDDAALVALLERGADVGAAQPDGATALHWAAHRADVDAVRRLLEAGADPSVANRAGVTPLFLASEAGDAETIRLLLEAGADASERFRNGETPLMMAARTGNTEAIEVLLEHGADVDAAEELRGTTALMWAAAYSNPEAVRLLVERGADASLRSSPIPRGRRPYLAPPARERIEEYEKGTGLRGASVEFELDEEPQLDVSNLFDAPPEAAAEARPEAAGDAAEPADVAAGEDEDAAAFDRQPSPRDWGGLTALIFAAREGDMESARILIEAGADVNQTSEYGWTALLTATQNRYYRLGRYLL